ncbi:MAG: hypothetical protein D6762_04320 [Candidatus Neomarinimicrobiota bacterium]|nr:MAG: hypothetical protein D6762_04320 [Candidatus Neomarinimicrobiota bacterium]
MIHHIRSVHLLLTISLLAVGLTAQHVPSSERGDPNYRRQTDIDGNKVRTSIFNFGLTGRTGANPGEIPYEWPINSGKHYIALTGLFVGSEVLTEEGTLSPFVTVPLGRTDNSGNSMMFEPVPEYLNPNSSRIAKSDEPDTWPAVWPDKLEDESDPGWPGSWNGFFGKNQFNADQEIYFKISDDRNFLRGKTYIPDTTDITRRGMGILSGVRVMEWSQVLVEDVVFVLYEIKNDGTKDLDKVSFCLWLADLVGGDGDSGDDTPDFDLLYDIAWSMDADGIGNAAFGSDPVGVAATAYLETPGNAVDRIDNDGDGEPLGPVVTEEWAATEDRTNGVDDNFNGLVDESEAHIPFGNQSGVTYKDGIDDNGNGEPNSPTITADMIAAAATDYTPTSDFLTYSANWHRWPPHPEDDPVQNGQIHLLEVGDDDLGKAFADHIDNDESQEYPFGLGADTSGPRITQEIIDQAATDPYHRYRVPGTDIILYDVGPEDLGLRYADGIDNDGDGAVDEGIDEGIDEMVDESRDNGIDDDFDWNVFSDDVGRDGDLTTPDAGQGDGRPTTGTGTNLPGEPNIDKTDVSESDQMGLTRVNYDEAGSIPTGQDAALWLFYMTPGEFWQPPPGGQPPGDYDLFVTSAFFPIKAGDTKRISMAVCLGEDVEDARRNKDVAQQTYDEDYQFAKAPLPPHVKAIAGDHQVTLTWDAVAEASFDTYMDGIGSEGLDFEGYKIYRATDPEFADAYDITDAQGNLTFYTPLAQFDLVDGKEGFHEVAVNGIHYWLGEETGLTHTFVDRDVVNGQTYYYAVVSYDFGGDITNDIPPTESTRRLSINSLTGEISKGPNVVVVTPNPPAAGFVDASIDSFRLVQGTTSSSITYRIVDPTAVKQNHTYRVTFEDTVKKKVGGLFSPGYDTLTTKCFTLADVTDPDRIDTLIACSNRLKITDEQPVIDGFQLILDNQDFLYLNNQTSHWSADSLWNFVLNVFSLSTVVGIPQPADYRLIIDNMSEGTLILRAPDQTAMVVQDGYFSGNYNRTLNAFADHEVQGTWTLEIRDTGGDGGNTATNINLTVVDTSGNYHFYSFPDGPGISDYQDQISWTTDIADAYRIQTLKIAYTWTTVDTGHTRTEEYRAGFTRFYARDVNFHVEKRVQLTGVDSVDWETIPIAFGDYSPFESNEKNGLLDADSVETDWVVFLDNEKDGEPFPSWVFKMDYPRPWIKDHIYGPAPGDTVFLYINKPFLSSDIFEFTTTARHIDNDLLASQLKKIKVVPNPYVAAVAWEERNRFTSGRGPRSIHFNHLPPHCTIRIFTVSGELVRTIRHDSDQFEGTAEWDLLTKDNLSASYGVYVYHVEAEDPATGKILGEHIGKFAVIK